MFELRKINRWIAIAFAVLSALLIAIPEDMRKAIIAIFWENRVPVPVVRFRTRYDLPLLRRQCRYLVRPRGGKGNPGETSLANYALERANLKQLTDIVTGIPNQQKLEIDLRKRLEEMQGNDSYQLVMIDLEKFGDLNRAFGHQRVDQVIAYIAQEVYNTMRRSEEIYKHSRPDTARTGTFIRRIYRKYALAVTSFCFCSRVLKHRLLVFCRGSMISLKEASPHILLPLSSTRRVGNCNFMLVSAGLILRTV